MGAVSGALLSVTSGPGRAANGLMAVRVWPSSDYTRITLEHRDALRFEHFRLDGYDPHPRIAAPVAV